MRWQYSLWYLRSGRVCAPQSHICTCVRKSTVFGGFLGKLSRALASLFCQTLMILSWLWAYLWRFQKFVGLLLSWRVGEAVFCAYNVPCAFCILMLCDSWISRESPWMWLFMSLICPWFFNVFHAILESLDFWRSHLCFSSCCGSVSQHALAVMALKRGGPPAHQGVHWSLTCTLCTFDPN